MRFDENERDFTPPLETGFEIDPARAGSPGDMGGSVEEDVDAHPYPNTFSEDDGMWLRMARDAWESSETWFDSSMRQALERAYAHFRGVHAPGSKYHTEQYRKKSRIFRQKTRSAIRRGEAAHAVAFFSTHDVVHCEPDNDTDPVQVLAAEIHNALLNKRLNKPKRRWFMTLIGAAQDAMTAGVVVSKQHWRYLEADVEMQNEFTDGTTGPGGIDKKVLLDEPGISLIPVENFRFDPAADWIDPVNTSPYLIEIEPTYVIELRERMKRGEYRQLPKGLMAAAIQQDWDSIRKAREGQRIDKYDNDTAINDYQSVWVYHYIVRIGGQDWCYDTLGQEYLLSDPIPIEEMYPHSTTGNRPYVMGSAILEAHKNYPGGVPQLIEDLQEETNDIVNLRLDRLKHDINPHWLVRRGRGVDIRSLIRNVSSGVTFVTDTTGDVKQMDAKSVPPQAYEEQNRLNLDIDDIVGNFSQATVQSNRAMNQTVGGMNLASADASLLQEYTIRTVAFTWAQPVLEQVMQMEAVYETDEKILQAIATRLQVDMEQVMAALDQDVNVNVNVGFGATNPEKRIAKLALGLSTLATYFPDTLKGADQAEITKEVFGALGYEDGSRFFPMLNERNRENPMVQQLEQRVQELEQLLQGKQMEIQGKVTVAEITAQAGLAKEKMKQQTEMFKLQALGDQDRYKTLIQNRLDQLDQQINQAKEERERMQLWMEREALSQHILESNREWNLRVEEAAQARVEGGEGGEKPKTNGAAGDGAMNLEGVDRAGIVSRDDYGAIVDSPV